MVHILTTLFLMARKKHGDLDRAVDFSQQNDARLIYGDRSAADENYDFNAKLRGLRAFLKHRLEIQTFEIE